MWVTYNYLCTTTPFIPTTMHLTPCRGKIGIKTTKSLNVLTLKYTFQNSYDLLVYDRYYDNNDLFA